MVDIQKRDDEHKKLERQNTPSLIDAFFNDPFFTSFAPSLLGNRRLGGMTSPFPKVDVSETDDAITVTANIPGVDPDDVNVEVGDDYLSLAGTITRTRDDTGENDRTYRAEREYGEFRREFTLPSRVDADNISAKAKDGVLTITLPKSEKETRRSVKVTRED